jgi:hypothetical protein
MAGEIKMELFDTQALIEKPMQEFGFYEHAPVFVEAAADCKKNSLGVHTRNLGKPSWRARESKCVPTGIGMMQRKQL